MIEIVPPNRKRGSGLEAPRVNYEKRSEKMKKVSEAGDQEEEQSEKVAEKIVDELEMIGIKCPRCGLKNVKESAELSDKFGRTYLECLDCKHYWDDEKM